jgi:hypothetical protein
MEENQNLNHRATTFTKRIFILWVVNSPRLKRAFLRRISVFLDDRVADEMLLAAGAKVNTVDEYGETPLTLACDTGNETLIKELVEAGADVNATRWDGATALMIVADVMLCSTTIRSPANNLFSSFCSVVSSCFFGFLCGR